MTTVLHRGSARLSNPAVANAARKRGVLARKLRRIVKARRRKAEQRQ